MYIRPPGRLCCASVCDGFNLLIYNIYVSDHRAVSAVLAFATDSDLLPSRRGTGLQVCYTYIYITYIYIICIYIYVCMYI